MGNWLISNLATIVIGLVVLAIVGVVIGFMVRSKRKGSSSCGCGGGCGSCPMSGQCHHDR